MYNITSSAKWVFILTIFVFTVSTQISCNNSNAQNKTMVQDEQGIPKLLEREGDLAKAAEWNNTKMKVAELKTKVAQNPKDVKPRLQLATIYMSEARITGDAYYYQASIKILNDVIALDPNSFEAYTYKASIAMSLHQFEEAKKLATKAQSINPNNAYVYGVLVDANVELGNYQEAIAMSDKMQSLKPSLESYARASYLREIHGDNMGAIEVMHMAVKAGIPGSESAEWARVTLGDLYLSIGKLDTAKMIYEATLSVRPNFPNAEIGLAKVAKAKKDYTTAIKHTENAIRTVSEVAYVSMLGELYGLNGNKQKQDEIEKEVVTLLLDAEKDQDKALMKHNSNRELAQAYMAIGDYDNALKFAKADLALRPNNIDANELTAWIYYKKGDYKNAEKHVVTMLATNTNNSEKLYKAGVIYARVNDTEKASKYIDKAKDVNPYINPSILLASK